MIELNLPKNVEYIINKLEEAGFSAYAVGGCVRDVILGKEPHDWDITTSARPEQIAEIFKDDKILEVGLQFGTSTIVLDGEPFEVTTYRRDGLYFDQRHPDSVTFVDDIEEDLSRRDFTINAMAYSPTRGLVDPFGGQEDLENKTLKCVGNPSDRFKEDAIRILRALRFSAVYELNIDEKIKEAMLSNLDGIDKISKERITKEFITFLEKAKAPGQTLMDNKELLFKIIPELEVCNEFDQMSKYHQFDVLTHILKSVDEVPTRLVSGHELMLARFAALLHDVGKPAACEYVEGKNERHFKGHAFKSKEIAEKIFDKDFRLSSETRNLLLKMIEKHEDRKSPTFANATRIVNDFGVEHIKAYLAVQFGDTLSHGENLSPAITKVLNDNEENLFKMLKLVDEVGITPFTTKDLAITGNDILKVLKDLDIKSGPIVGKVLEVVYNKVIEGFLQNDKDDILAILPELTKDIESGRYAEKIEEHKKSVSLLKKDFFYTKEKLTVSKGRLEERREELKKNGLPTFAVDKELKEINSKIKILETEVKAPLFVIENSADEPTDEVFSEFDNIQKKLLLSKTALSLCDIYNLKNECTIYELRIKNYLNFCETQRNEHDTEYVKKFIASIKKVKNILDHYIKLLEKIDFDSMDVPEIAKRITATKENYTTVKETWWNFKRDEKIKEIEAAYANFHKTQEQNKGQIPDNR